MAKRFASWWTGPKQNAGPNNLVDSHFGPIIINTNDVYVGGDIVKYGIWETDQVTLLLRLADFLVAQFGKITFFDIGANIGTHTLALAGRFPDQCLVRSFEPQEQIFHMLCGTVALNNLENVHCHCLVVADVDGQIIEFDLPDYKSRNNFGGLGIMRSDAERTADGIVRSGRKQTAKTVTLDSFHEPVHLLKIDVEGMEYNVLRGAEQTINSSRPICFVEIHEPDTGACRAFFAGHGYVIVPKGADLLAIPQEHIGALTRHHGSLLQPAHSPRASTNLDFASPGHDHRNMPKASSTLPLDDESELGSKLDPSRPRLFKSGFKDAGVVHAMLAEAITETLAQTPALAALEQSRFSLAYLRSLIAADPAYVLLAKTAANEPAGFFICGPEHGVLVIYWTYLRPNFRKGGLALSLMRQFITYWDFGRFHKIMLYVRTSNRSSLAVVRRLGYKELGVLQKQIAGEDFVQFEWPLTKTIAAYDPPIVMSRFKSFQLWCRAKLAGA